MQNERSYQLGRALRRFFHRYRLLAILLLAAAVVITMLTKQKNVPEQGGSIASSGTTLSQTGTGTAKDGEMRAVWVSCITLSTVESHTEEAFRKFFSEIVEVSKKNGMNALIVQVRPFSDAMYRSTIFPWSHILSGTQGKDSGYDPLAIMVSMAHDAGLELHAWVNPFRIRSTSVPQTLSADNPAVRFLADESTKDYVHETETGTYYDPAYSAVRELVADGVCEIADNYDVDGIQFDDYFYPTTDESFDQKAYDAYLSTVSQGAAALTRAEWRTANINAMVALVYSRLKERGVTFGIAPQGNIENDKNMGADVSTWGSVSGYVDYLCPQLYVNFENSYLPFDRGASEWKSLVTNENIKLYYGLALYKAGSEVDNGTWKKADNIISRQISLGRELSCDGFMFYSWEFLTAEASEKEVANAVALFE